MTPRRRAPFAAPLLCASLAACGPTGEPPSNGVRFRVRIENTSAGGAIPVPLSPGAWAVHANPGVLFTPGAPDRGLGLAAIARDGDPSALGASLAAQPGVASSGVFDTPAGAPFRGPLLPGDGAAYEFVVTATAAAPRLSFATMFTMSNDLFAAPDERGLALFEPDGAPVTERVYTADVHFWDGGVERNEAPRSGPNQAYGGAGMGSGPAEGVVAPFTDSTRALPLASGLVSVTVAESGGVFTVTVENVSASRGAVVTPVSPVFWATHDATWSVFSEAANAPANPGLESLAEDGSPDALVAAHAGAPGVGSSGAQRETVERAGARGPAAPGERFRFEVRPDAAHPRLSIAAAVREANDAFIALPPAGVALLTGAGAPRPAADVNADIERALAVWDAGTEANEAPGVGANQGPRQPAPNTGPADAIARARRYADEANDFASAAGVAEVSIVAGAAPLSFEVTVRPAAAASRFALSPVAWLLHDGSARLFTEGSRAGEGLERLAEDGDATALVASARGAAGVGDAGVATPAAAAGGTIAFTVTADAAHRHLNIASAISPANDAFVSLGAEGVALLTPAGERRGNADIAADVAARLRAWDAGTEQNQSGGAGADQLGRQTAPNTGAGEGGGLVRRLDDPVWGYPRPAAVLRVTVTRVE